MPSWLVLFAIIVVCLTVLLFIKRDTTEGFGLFKDEQMAFANKQYTYFHDTAGKGIFTNPGLNLSGLNEALAQPDLYLAKSKDRDYTSYFAEDPEIAYNQKDEAFCRNALSPRDLPKRTQGADVGCGWYYVDNPAVPSSGALGTINGPIFSKTLPMNGEWIWDIPTAIMKEEIKACRRVKSCDLISVDGIRGKCGFCERLGYAVPINYDGTEKYPDSEIGSCGQLTIKDATGCFKPTPKPLITSDGIDCGTYGYPSPDNSMRMYSKSECDALNGTLSPNGECVNKAGVSYSWSCRALNRPNVAGVVMEEEEEEEDGSGMKKVVTVVKNICAPNANGSLSRDCLQSLATGLGYAKTGAMMRLLSGNAAPGETDRLAIDELKKSGYAVPNAILGSGDIDMQSAANLYQKIYEAIARGQNALTRQAAKWLVTGTDTFDICEIDANATGPFPTACLQRAFRMSGCQASGKKYPDDRTALDYANKSWTAVNSMFSNLFATMKSSKASEQDAAVKDCLGFTYARPPCDLLMGDMTYNSDIRGIKPNLAGKHLFMFVDVLRSSNNSDYNNGQNDGCTSAFFTDKRPITNFNTSFTVHDRNTHDHGMTFIIQNKSVNAIGMARGKAFNFGSAGITPSLVIPLLARSPIGLVLNGESFPDKNLFPADRISNPVTNRHLYVEIKYSNNTLEISIANVGQTALKHSRTIPNVDLPTLLGGTTAWFGFTAGALMAKGGCNPVPAHHSYSINDWKMTHDFDVSAPEVVSPVQQPVFVPPTPQPVYVIPAKQPIMVTPVPQTITLNQVPQPVTLNTVPQAAAVTPQAAVTQAAVTTEPSDFLTEPMTYNSSGVKPKMVGGELLLSDEPTLRGSTKVWYTIDPSAFLTKKRPITNFSTSFKVSWGDGQFTQPGNLTFSIQNASPNSLGGTIFSRKDVHPGVAISIMCRQDYGITAGFITSTKGVGAQPEPSRARPYAHFDKFEYHSLDTGNIKASLGLKDGAKWLLNVEIKYSNNTLVLIITNAENTDLEYTHRFNNVDLPTLLGSTKAWMGFTVGGGEMIYSRNGGYSRWPYPPKMTISNWKIQNI
jgi:hypothetical protein